MYYNEFLLYRAILEPESKILRTITLEFQDFSRVFQDLCIFPGLSRPGNLNILISGLSTTFQGLYEPCSTNRDFLVGDTPSLLIKDRTLRSEHTRGGYWVGVSGLVVRVSDS